MRPFFIACVVEGHGEVTAVPALLHLLTRSIAPELSLRVLDPIRRSRDKIVKEGELERDIRDAANQLDSEGADRNGCIVVFLDAEGDCAATLGPSLRRRASSVRPSIKTEVVLAVQEFEAWILASSRALVREGLMTSVYEPTNRIEFIRDAKTALKQRLPGNRYSPTIDQARLIRRIDVDEARQTKSFDRLFKRWQELLSKV